ncbi:MAG TPA: hypothetical protein P5559_06650 [Candidatus Limiplasma sp.]|nr:hypothetical protein [Candidatus Limiplasma sp.]
MEDVYKSLFVILPVGMMIGLIFYFTARKKRELHQRLEAYCEQHGYQMDEINQRLHRAVVIQGNGWQLTTGVQSSDVQTSSGSSYTFAYTRWETTPNTENDNPFVWLGTVSGSISRLGNNLLPLLTIFGIDGTEHIHIVALEEPLHRRFAMVADELPGISEAGAEMSRLLADWPEYWPLRATLGTNFAQINVSGKKFDKPEDLDRIIRMGTGFLTYLESINRPIKEL